MPTYQFIKRDITEKKWNYDNVVLTQKVKNAEEAKRKAAELGVTGDYPGDVLYQCGGKKHYWRLPAEAHDWWQRGLLVKGADGKWRKKRTDVKPDQKLSHILRPDTILVRTRD